MANATEPMADYAFWQTIVGGFGLAALVVSLCYTAKATRAAALATKAAIRANAISRDTAKKELRAYVSLAPAGVKFDEMGRPIIVTAQKNNGQTPALLTRAFAVPDELPYPLPANHEFPQDAFGTDTNVVHPGHRFTVEYSCETIALQSDLLGSDPARRTYFIGAVRYEDIYGKEHTTRACWSYDMHLLTLALNKWGDTPEKDREPIKVDFNYADNRYNNAD